MPPPNLLSLFLLLLCCWRPCGSSSQGCGLRQFAVLDEKSPGSETNSSLTLIRRCSGGCHANTADAAASKDDVDADDLKDGFVASSSRCIPSSTRMREISVPLMLMEEENGARKVEEEGFSVSAKSVGGGQRKKPFRRKSTVLVEVEEHLDCVCSTGAHDSKTIPSTSPRRRSRREALRGSSSTTLSSLIASSASTVRSPPADDSYYQTCLACKQQAEACEERFNHGDGCWFSSCLIMNSCS